MAADHFIKSLFAFSGPHATYVCLIFLFDVLLCTSNCMSCCDSDTWEMWRSGVDAPSHEGTWVRFYLSPFFFAKNRIAQNEGHVENSRFLFMFLIVFMSPHSSLFLESFLNIPIIVHLLLALFRTLLPLSKSFFEVIFHNRFSISFSFRFVTLLRFINLFSCFVPFTMLYRTSTSAGMQNSMAMTMSSTMTQMVQSLFFCRWN